MIDTMDVQAWELKAQGKHVVANPPLELKYPPNTDVLATISFSAIKTQGWGPGAFDAYGLVSEWSQYPPDGSESAFGRKGSLLPADLQTWAFIKNCARIRFHLEATNAYVIALVTVYKYS